MPRRLLSEDQIHSDYCNPAHQRRREVLRDTVEKFTANHQYYRDQALKNHQAWKKSSTGSPVVRVLKGDWGDVTQQLSKENGQIYAVLNMANASTPGGGYLEGMIAQEENMYRRSDCHFYVKEKDLDSEGNYFTKAMTKLINGKKGRVYLNTDHPRVCIKGREKYDRKTGVMTGYKNLNPEEYFLFFELKSAADDLREKGKTFSEASMRRKIAAQLDTLREKNIRHVVLSAFGCGAFLNPPDQVARIYREELEKRPDYFDDVAFAIFYPGYGADNHPIF